MDGKPVAASPPSSSTSPAHEFSFTISLHHPSETYDKVLHHEPPPSSLSAVVDLSPADNIFFHGHLLPLHLLSQFPNISPRSSTNSLDSFTLPIRDLVGENDEINTTTENNIPSDKTNKLPKLHDSFDYSTTEVHGRTKSKSISLFSLSKWRKGREKDDQETRHNKKKLKFDVVSQVLKRYIRMVRPLLSFGSSESRRSSSHMMNKRFHNQPHSFSGSTSSRCNQDQFKIERRREFSAPASMWTSPANSGPLLPNGALFTSTSESTMDELQAAIQAAITHCKNSITMEEKVKCQT